VVVIIIIINKEKKKDIKSCWVFDQIINDQTTTTLTC
jgi:hypothetical protein